MSKKQLGTGIILLSLGVGLWFLRKKDDKWTAEETVFQADRPQKKQKTKWMLEEEAYQKDRKEKDKEYSIEQRSWKETVAQAQHGTPRTMPATEAAHMTRHWDKLQEATGEPRFSTIAPFPEVTHRMPNPEKVRLVNRELARLRTVQRAVKDNIDIWHKGGAPDGPRFVDPLNTWNMISGDEADQQNHKILEEIDRLEEFKSDLLAVKPFKYHVLADQVLTTWPESFIPATNTSKIF